jgi:hypothetical protein
MVYGRADFLLPVESIKEGLVTFQSRMRNFDGNGLVGTKIGASIDRNRIATRNYAVNSEMIELVAGINWDSSRVAMEAVQSNE